MSDLFKQYYFYYPCAFYPYRDFHSVDYSKISGLDDRMRHIGFTDVIRLKYDTLVNVYYLGKLDFGLPDSVKAYILRKVKEDKNSVPNDVRYEDWNSGGVLNEDYYGDDAEYWDRISTDVISLFQDLAYPGYNSFPIFVEGRRVAQKYIHDNMYLLNKDDFVNIESFLLSGRFIDENRLIDDVIKLFPYMSIGRIDVRCDIFPFFDIDALIKDGLVSWYIGIEQAYEHDFECEKHGKLLSIDEYNVVCGLTFKDAVIDKKYLPYLDDGFTGNFVDKIFQEYEALRKKDYKKYYKMARNLDMVQDGDVDETLEEYFNLSMVETGKTSMNMTKERLDFINKQEEALHVLSTSPK